MKIILKVLLILFILASNTMFSQDTNIVKYFPLKVGNVWFYNGSATIGVMGCFRTFYQKIFIDSSKIITGKVFYKFNVQTLYLTGQGNCGGFSFIENGTYYRIDSVSGNIYKYYSNYTNCSLSPYERLIDSLKSNRLGDTAYICNSGSYMPGKKLFDTASYPFLNVQLSSKTFGPATYIDYIPTNVFSKNFGLVKYAESGPGFSSQSNLKGCIIGGVVYGDTTFSVIGINQISTEVPTGFNLSQNYPNPFNPTTQIVFELPKSSFTSLVAYDASGREISILVNEELQAGSYSVDWNASAYPSGVYFYKITAGEYVQTRKMVLIK